MGFSGMEKKVTIIIPNYNGGHLLKENLSRVINAAKFYSPKTEIIVVDDKSTDDSLEILEKNFPQVKVIVKEKNSGFSSSCNLGVRQATGEVVVLLNTDLYPEKDFLMPLVKHFANSEVFAVGCLEKSQEEKGIVLRGRGIGFFHNGFLIHQRGEINKTNTLWASGGSAAFAKEKWQQLNGFDEIYNPYYWEDIDLSYRAQKMGWKVLFEKNSAVWHKHDQGAIRKNYKSDYIEAIAFRNQLLFMWKNIDTDLLIEHIFLLPTNLIKFILARKETFVRGFLLAVGKLPQALLKRRKNKFVVSDRLVVKEFHSEIHR